MPAITAKNSLQTWYTETVLKYWLYCLFVILLQFFSLYPKSWSIQMYQNGFGTKIWKYCVAPIFAPLPPLDRFTPMPIRQWRQKDSHNDGMCTCCFRYQKYQRHRADQILRPLGGSTWTDRKMSYLRISQYGTGYESADLRWKGRGNGFKTSKLHCALPGYTSGISGRWTLFRLVVVRCISIRCWKTIAQEVETLSYPEVREGVPTVQ